MSILSLFEATMSHVEYKLNKMNNQRSTKGHRMPPDYRKLACLRRRWEWSSFLKKMCEAELYKIEKEEHSTLKRKHPIESDYEEKRTVKKRRIDTSHRLAKPRIALFQPTLFCKQPFLFSTNTPTTPTYQPLSCS